MDQEELTDEQGDSAYDGFSLLIQVNKEMVSVL